MAAKQKAKTPSKGRPKGMPRTSAEIAADAMRTGRPAVASDMAVSKGVTMRLTPAEHRQFAREAKRLKMGLSAYLRHCWQTTKEGIKSGKTVSQSNPAKKSRDRKTGKRG
jgi:hypothetical protein